MNASELKKKYLDFFRTKKHAIIKSASLIPEHDPTILFTTAGMHPLIPFLTGQPHPLGKRIANVQKCIRTQDIDEVGDNSHTTFFEMLGNWSFGDYFKKEAIEWSWEFLTDKKWLGLDPKRIAISCFKGDSNAPKDEESAEIWESVGIPSSRIVFLPKSENWWGPVGESGPCGPDSEMFYWVPNNKPAPKRFNPKDDNWVEIWNNVFMQYNKIGKDKFEQSTQKSVDTGMGVERVTMILQGKTTIFDTELFQPIFEEISEISNTKPNESNIKSYRIISDHIRAATFLLGDERHVVPSNLDQGYILRRFIRRSIRHAKLIGINDPFCEKVARIVISIYKKAYPELEKNRKFILTELEKEEKKFRATLEKGLREFKKISKKGDINGKQAFLLYQSYGFPIEMITELAEEEKIKVNIKGFEKEYKKHRTLSKRGAARKFKGGLSESSEVTARLHTATHLLGEAIRKVMKDENITQKGSNITPQRLRYDFNFDRKLTEKEIHDIEKEVNKRIKENLIVTKKEMTLDEALKSGAQKEFGVKYPSKVWVYSVGKYSKEICMGPHVKNTLEIGKFKIKKEESSSAGIRRIKAILTK